MKRHLLGVILFIIVSLFVGETGCFAQKRPWYRTEKYLHRRERGAPRYKKPTTKVPSMHQIRQRFYRLDWHDTRKPDSPKSVVQTSRETLVGNDAFITPIDQLRISLSHGEIAEWIINQALAHEPAGFSGETSPAILLRAAERFVRQTGALPRFSIPDKPVDRYTAAERHETQLRHSIYSLLIRSTPKDMAANVELFHLQQFMMQHTSPDQLAEQLLIFSRHNGRLPRRTIPGKAKMDYTAAEYFETHLRRGLDKLLQQESTNPGRIPHKTRKKLPDLSLAQKRILSQGVVPWQATHTLVNTDPIAWDLILEFPEWLTRNQNYFMAMQGTNKAIEAIRVAMANGTVDDTMYEVMLWLRQMNLGMQEDGSLVHAVYRGNNPMLPQAKDFHKIIKIQGMPLEQAAAAFTFEHPHVRFIQDEKSLLGLRLSPGVTRQEIAAVLSALVPPEFEVRMGAHEFEIHNDKTTIDFERGNLHLHIEKIAEEGEGNTDISYALELKLSWLVGDKKPQQILHLYRELFRPYMDNYMRSYSLSAPIPVF